MKEEGSYMAKYWRGRVFGLKIVLGNRTKDGGGKGGGACAWQERRTSNQSVRIWACAWQYIVVELEGMRALENEPGN